LSAKDLELHQKVKPLAKLINFFRPTYRFDTRRARKLDDWRSNFYDDPLFEGFKISAENLLRNE
jgi:hypothetical protein